MSKQAKINNLWSQYDAMTGKGSLKAKAALVAQIRELEETK